jgi:hypothetical protein
MGNKGNGGDDEIRICGGVGCDVDVVDIRGELCGCNCGWGDREGDLRWGCNGATEVRPVGDGETTGDTAIGEDGLRNGFLLDIMRN